MKRFLALFLALLMVACLLVSCNNTCKEHKDENTDGICDNCGEAVQIPCTKHSDLNLDGKCDTCGAAVTPEVNDAVAKALADAVKAQIASAKSMKVSFDFDLLMFEEGVAEHKKGATLNATILLSRTDKGFNAKVDVLTKETQGTESTELVNGTILYFVDGILYTRDDENDDFDVSDLTILFEESSENDTAEVAMVKSMLNTMKQMLDGVSLSEEELTALGKDFLTTFKVANNKGSFTIDVKPVFDSFKTYITAIDLETKTMESLINDALALVDKELTVDVIFGKLTEIGKMSVTEAWTAFDAWLTENYQTTLQGIYDTVIANEQVKALIGTMIYVDGEEFDFDAWYEETLVGLKLADLPELYFGEAAEEIMATPIYDLIMSLIPSEDPEAEYPGIETFFAVIKEEFLALTLAEWEVMLDAPIFTAVQRMLDAITVNALNAKAEVTFKDIFSIDTLALNYNIDVELKNIFGSEAPEGGAMPLEAEDEIVTVRLTATLKLAEISADAVTITAPTNIKMYY